MSFKGFFRMILGEDYKNLREKDLSEIIGDHLRYLGDGYCEHEKNMIICSLTAPELDESSMIRDLHRLLMILERSEDKLYLYIDAGINSITPHEIIKRIEGLSSTGEVFQKILEYVAEEYQRAINKIGERIDLVEELIEREELEEVIRETHDIRRNLIMMRRHMRNFLGMLREIYGDQRILSYLPKPQRVFELVDEISIAIEMSEIYRETISSIREIHASLLGLKLNEVVKRLTAITVVLMLPTLIASIYGMNFDTSKPLNMPELSWGFGYIYALSLMLVSSIVGYMVLRLKKWI